MTKRTELEQKTQEGLQNFVSFNQNTHTPLVAGVALQIYKTLAERYRPDLPITDTQGVTLEESIKAEVSTLTEQWCELFQKYNLITENPEIFKAKLENVIDSFNSEYDRVPSLGAHQYLSLRHIFRVLLPAIHDEQYFLPNANVSTQEFARLIYELLQTMPSGHCSLGVRHDLLAVLNFRYKGIVLLYEGTSGSQMLVSEFYTQKLQQLFEIDPETAFQVACGMFSISPNTPAYPNFLNDEPKLKEALKARVQAVLGIDPFVSNSEDSENIKEFKRSLQDVIDNRSLLTFIPPGYEASFEAIRVMQDKRQTQSFPKAVLQQFENCRTLAAFQQTVQPFVKWRAFYQKIEQYTRLFVMSDEEIRLRNFSQTLIMRMRDWGYPSAFALDKSQESYLTEAQDEFGHLYDAMVLSNRQQFSVDLDDHFAILNIELENYKKALEQTIAQDPWRLGDSLIETRDLFERWLGVHKIFQGFWNKYRSTLRLDDASLERLIKENTVEEQGQMVCYIRPEHINRIFLNALHRSPAMWSPLFCTALGYVLDYVRQSSEESLVKVRASSYPDTLLNQLDWLLTIARSEEKCITSLPDVKTHYISSGNLKNTILGSGLDASKLLSLTELPLLLIHLPQNVALSNFNEKIGLQGWVALLRAFAPNAKMKQTIHELVQNFPPNERSAYELFLLWSFNSSGKMLKDLILSSPVQTHLDHFYDLDPEGFVDLWHFFDNRALMNFFERMHPDDQWDLIRRKCPLLSRVPSYRHMGMNRSYPEYIEPSMLPFILLHAREKIDLDSMEVDWMNIKSYFDYTSYPGSATNSKSAAYSESAADFLFQAMLLSQPIEFLLDSPALGNLRDWNFVVSALPEEQAEKLKELREPPTSASLSESTQTLFTRSEKRPIGDDLPDSKRLK